VTRTFTLAEANALIPRIATVLGRCTQLLGQAQRIARQLAEAGVQPPALAGGAPDEDDLPDDRPELAGLLHKAIALGDTAIEQGRILEGMGVVVQDLERGRVAFRSVIDGQREVFLSWQLGERQITHWHEVDAAFVDRRPVEGHAFFRSRQLVPPRSPE